MSLLSLLRLVMEHVPWLSNCESELATQILAVVGRRQQRERCPSHGRPPHGPMCCVMQMASPMGMAVRLLLRQKPGLLLSSRLLQKLSRSCLLLSLLLGSLRRLSLRELLG